ncbi:excisionase family DNA binding protein [Brachybacterium sp. AG952]|uniref:helix-turn-helix domain-containing protein n=1 Tax=Brachybacterium sp. AG952 TaxID=2183989 RepID=UPI00105F3AE1|nr:helix-turn-helix domain-containing protein [Brachybacterium sp. AG952]TDP79760.1 excisionase family DNA binding protein [Brachybacterium sp. AG952]
MPAFTQSPPIISIPEAAARGYASEATLRRHIRAGRLPAIRIGHRIKLRVADLDAHVDAAGVSPVDSAISVIADHVDDLDEAHRARLSALLGGDAA